MMSIKIEQVTEPVVLGEGPHWDSNQNVLYFVSILEHTIHKYDPSTGLHTRTKLDDQVGFIVPIEGTRDQFVVGSGKKVLVIRWDGSEGTPVATLGVLGEVDQDAVIPTSINDGKADPKGRLVAGTVPGITVSNFDQLPTNHCSLYLITNTDTPKKLTSNITLANGLAWDLNEKAFYYVDTWEYAVRRYEYDVDTGDISNLKYIFDLKENNIKGMADGMTIDTDGNLWIAVFRSSLVINIDPRTGKLLRTVEMPVSQVTSVTFGGHNMDVLYVTSASMSFEEPQEPPSGAVFRITGLGVKGLPNVEFKLY